MTMTKTSSFSDVRPSNPMTRYRLFKLMEEIANEDPHRKNPTVNNTCVYDHPKTHEHCFAGEVFFRVFGKVPPVEQNKIVVNQLGWKPRRTKSVRTYFTGSAWDLLVEGQSKADDNFTWSRIVNYLRDI